MKSWTPPQLPEGLLEALGLTRFVAVDVETTGLDPTRERIIEVGAVRFEAGKETAAFSSLIACPHPLSPAIVKLTGISDVMLQGQPESAVVMRDFADFAGDDPLVGQNIKFDLDFLRQDLKAVHKATWLNKKRVVDTALLARVLLPTLPSKGLSSLADYFNLDRDVSHRALPDARRCGKVLLSLLAYFPRVDIKNVNLLQRIAGGIRHPSAWIFSSWAEYLIRTSSLKGRFQEHRLPYLRNNILGSLPSSTSYDAGRAQAEEGDEFVEIPESEIARYFATGSPLKKVFTGYEVRPEQKKMATETAKALNQGRILCVEAGTGVGKSMAYLIPALYWAEANRDLGERVIVSTNTKNLQEQLFYKDLPTLKDVLPFRFSAVLLKGRGNYLCRRRWENLTTQSSISLSPQDGEALLSLVLWVSQTVTVDISEAGGMEGRGFLWARIASEAGSCRGKRCRHRHHCFHLRVRQTAARAHAVVVNHALLMADLAANRVPIGLYRTLIVDEAHHLEKAAAQHLGRELNAWTIRSWASRTFDAEGIPKGLLQQILLGIGAARKPHPSLDGLQAMLEDTTEAVSKLRNTSDEFFRQLTEAARRAAPPKENDYTQKLRLREPDRFFLELGEKGEALTHSLSEIARKMEIIRDSLTDFSAEVLPQAEDWLVDLRGALEELLDISETLKFFRQPADENWVYWTEIPSRREADAVFYAAPLNAGDILKDQLFDPLRAGVLTSATLTVSGRFHYFMRKVGLRNSYNVSTLQLGSPFSFPDQMLIALPDFLPSPRDSDFESRCADLICDLIEELDCGTLGLFTSYKMLTRVADNLQKRSSGRRILVQGRDGSRDSLLGRFRRDPASVLLGTDSFWEGIDVVGEALELLLVAKLPFEVPSEPLVEARLEKLKAEGKDPFMFYTVPEAIIRLRQGIGRLIRSKTDRGAAVIFDSRLANTRYGKAFTASLPTKIKLLNTKDDLLHTVRAFLKKGRNALEPK